ncbi:MAG: hypothetical protein A2358_04185 [Candidatus Staskawiczbacteria bacterium RIFOXYB1_FULL_37_44]|uniref:TspO protein n=1 Tax=Candidatus Staskawiczbacteria bacterium RIFOXYB1_FULL_37_44 TaxID=1802223 RepID=A0A1G2ITY8_9BACT|nr:MAG: hypothetical protein A2358_04185 [Candidatus Staskawiczbacteria bacterium RIFOXYB1_FULL_37_44]OGZ82997.1 MAG: hypothetical protein A2416_01885 [Candidatus Staskawiczbacteria bacterium RIFOXYC1_FULL_37_52]
MKNTVKFLVSIIICEAAGAVGSIFTAPEIKEWYATLAKPAINPPNWIFGPVWTTLFILMGISLYLVWSKNFKVVPASAKAMAWRGNPWNKYSQKFYSGSWQKANVIIIFSLQLFLNILWSVIFFGFHQTGIAFFELLMLWFAILYVIVNFYRISKPSAYLLIPYLLWVSFAGFLNLSIWLLNL